MQVIDRESALWDYLTDDLQGLIEDGEKLIDHAKKHGENDATDFSYLVFPFSKAYEGFLKRLFLDLDLIKEDEYYGDDIRIGRLLNPHFMKDHGNVFDKLCSSAGNGTEIAENLWVIWKKGRNRVFHYFPHNFRRLDYDEALEIINELVGAMGLAVTRCEINGNKERKKKKKKSKAEVNSIV